MDLGGGSKVELTDLADGLDVGREREREGCSQGRVFGLSGWGNTGPSTEAKKTREQQICGGGHKISDATVAAVGCLSETKAGVLSKQFYARS